MNRLWNWLKRAIERRPITFVIVGGTISYLCGMTILALTFKQGLDLEVIQIWSGMAFGSVIPISFHWFVARYEKRSMLAQVIALIPAIFLFSFVTLGAGMVGVKTQSCIQHPLTGELVECQSEIRMFHEID